jgi:hypothetical protein
MKKAIKKITFNKNTIILLSGKDAAGIQAGAPLPTKPYQSCKIACIPPPQDTSA